MREQHAFGKEEADNQLVSSGSSGSRGNPDEQRKDSAKQMDHIQQNNPKQAEKVDYSELGPQTPSMPISALSGNISGSRQEKGFASGSHPDNPGNNDSRRRAKTTPPALQRFGNYDLVQRIGIGGMGEVYLARQRTAFGREVAVKIIRPDLMHDITIRKRFLREAEVNAYLKHDHILPLVEFGEEQGRLFLVTPYIQGGTLSKRLKGGALSLAETHTLFTALVEAVSYLHKRAVIHRDLKPSNIMLDHEEGSERVYVRLIDFGIASLQGQTVSAPLTTAGHEMGTEAYMAPERLDGIAAPSNDIYSLGIILYQMLTGKLPEDAVAGDLAAAQDAMLPEPLAEVVLQSTAPEPDQRYASAEGLLKAFEHAYRSLSLSHFRVSSANPGTPTVGRNSSANSSPPVPLATAQPPGSLSVPATHAPNEHSSRPPVTPSVNRQAGALPDIPNLAPLSSSFNSTNAQSSRGYSDAAPPRPYPTRHANFESTEDIAQIGTARLQNENVLRPTSRPSQPSSSVRLRSEFVLPPLPDKTGPFKGEDYEAPTAYITPQPAQKSSMVSDHTTPLEKGEKAVPPPKQKKPVAPVATIISVIIIVIVFVIGSIAYSIFQSLDTATVTIAPPLQQVSTTFNLTAKPNQTSVDPNAGIVPLQTLSSTKSTSKSGNTTGQAACQIIVDPLPPHLQCQQAVSPGDVNNLMAPALRDVQSQIESDLRQQEQTQGETAVGKVVNPDNPTVTVNPPVGTVSNTVTVTISLNGTQNSIRTNDANAVAKQKLQGQLKPNFSLVDKTLQLSQAVVQSTDAQGNVQIKIAAAAWSRYNLTPGDISDIQNHIAGKSQNDARAFIAQKLKLDPNTIRIRVNTGDNLPGNGAQITVTESDPSTLPPVQVPAIP